MLRVWEIDFGAGRQIQRPLPRVADDSDDLTRAVKRNQTLSDRVFSGKEAARERLVDHDSGGALRRIAFAERAAFQQRNADGVEVIWGDGLPLRLRVIGPIHIRASLDPETAGRGAVSGHGQIIDDAHPLYAWQRGDLLFDRAQKIAALLKPPPLAVFALGIGRGGAAWVI